MKINFQSLKFTPRQDLMDYVHQKVGKLERFSDKIISADVKLYMLDIKSSDNKACDIKLAIPGNDILVKRNSFTFEQAVLNAVETLQNQLARKKGQKHNTDRITEAIEE